MRSLYFRHASLTEYVMIFGTPLGTEGHTRRFYVDDYSSSGRFQRDNFSVKFIGPRDMHHLPRPHAKRYKMPDGCWALEYARGFIPSMILFGLADMVTSTLDFYTFTQSTWLYTKVL